MPGDPNESIWKEFYTSLLSDHDPKEARLKADAALAGYLERWPREREVVLRDRHEDALLAVKREIVTWISDHIAQETRDFTYDLHNDNRTDAAQCCDELVAAIRQGLVTFWPLPRPGVPFMQRAEPPKLDDRLREDKLAVDTALTMLRAYLGVNARTSVVEMTSQARTNFDDDMTALERLREILSLPPRAMLPDIVAALEKHVKEPEVSRTTAAAPSRL